MFVQGHEIFEKEPKQNLLPSQSQSLIHNTPLTKKITNKPMISKDLKSARLNQLSESKAIKNKKKLDEENFSKLKKDKSIDILKCSYEQKRQYYNMYKKRRTVKSAYNVMLNNFHYKNSISKLKDETKFTRKELDNASEELKLLKYNEYAQNHNVQNYEIKTPVSSSSFVLSEHDSQQCGQFGGKQDKETNSIHIPLYKFKHHKYTNDANNVSSSSCEEVNLYQNLKPIEEISKSIRKRKQSKPSNPGGTQKASQKRRSQIMPEIGKQKVQLLTLAAFTSREETPSIAIDLVKNDSDDNINKDLNLPTEKRRSMKTPNLIAIQKMQ